MKNVIDFMTEQDYQRFTEILAVAEQAKANRPKPERKRGPMSLEQKIKQAEARKAKWEKMLEELLASEQ
jgi:hypothetical protein